MEPLVSIVILNWNGRHYLEKFLPFVLASSYSNFRVFVVDNASTDDSISFLADHFKTVQVIAHPQNHGFARGYNEALKKINSDYYVLLNSDVEVQPGWIAPIIRLMEGDRKIAACQPKLLQHADRASFEYAGAAGGWLDYLGYPFARGRIFDEHEVDRGQYDTTEPVFWATGAAMFVKAPLFHQFHGFDEFFFAHQEEIDFCWRLQRHGYKVYCCPESVVYHVGGGTLPKGDSRKVFLNFRNNLVMMSKNFPAAEAWWKISVRFFLDGVSAVKSLFAGQFTYFTAVIKAHGAYLHWLFFVDRQRAPSRGLKLQGYLRKSVVWQHFVRGKKKFSEIVWE